MGGQQIPLEKITKDAMEITRPDKTIGGISGEAMQSNPNAAATEDPEMTPTSPEAQPAIRKSRDEVITAAENPDQSTLRSEYDAIYQAAKSHALKYGRGTSPTEQGSPALLEAYSKLESDRAWLATLAINRLAFTKQEGFEATTQRLRTLIAELSQPAEGSSDRQ
ncbi:hypothetical protein JW962_03455 [Candidatus Dojkabacteria bacterium]|nr:hypothetical protein [Candidatus Dojkabacteria bacterium]